MNKPKDRGRRGEIFTLTVYETPVPQGRPRFSRRSGHAYDPKESRAWKNLLRFSIQQKCGVDNFEPFDKDCALVLAVVFKLPRPKSVSKEKRPEPTVKPDLDNLVKPIKDAMNGIVFKDDSQVVEILATKKYVVEKERPSVYIECWSS